MEIVCEFGRRSDGRDGGKTIDVSLFAYVGRQVSGDFVVMAGTFRDKPS